MLQPSGMWVIGLLFAGIAVLAMIQHRHVSRVRTDRARLFDGCAGSLESCEVLPRGLNFPLLRGRWRGNDVRVEPVIDTLSMRTLPVLWLVVTVRGRHEVPGHLSVLARMSGTEFYARHTETGKPVPLGWDWPDELAVRSSRSDVAIEPPELLQRIRGLMASGTVKHVALGPDRTRVVWKCATGDSATYRVTRRVDLTDVRVDAKTLSDLLGTMDELRSLWGASSVSVVGEAIG